VDLTGIIDIETEVARLLKEVERIKPLVDSYRRKVAAADYESKVPEAVRKTNAEKMAAYDTELQAVEVALATFREMQSAAAEKARDS
jgi:valyl-tRNA synthetase